MEIIKERTKEFKIPIGYHFKDDKRDLIIADRKKQGRYKYYKYKCNKCDYDCNEHYNNAQLIMDYWVREDVFLNGSGCVCCSNKISVPNINSIVAKEETHWMIQYFQGGYEEAKMYTPSSGKKLYFKCPHCNNVFNNSKRIADLNKNKSIGCICSDGFSYPEKFIYSLLEQLNIDFIYEYSTNWSNRKRYDFYIQSIETIIEVNGKQHYVDINRRKSRSLKEEMKNDEYKKVLAFNNGIKHYIELDCRESNLEWIKHNVLNSKLVNLLDISKIDWGKCEEFALCNLAKEICEYWNKRDCSETVSDLVSIYRISGNTIRNYLKRGNCNYDAGEENKKGKLVRVYKEGVFLATFNSISELERKSSEIIGVKLNTKYISEVANGKRKTYKGFTFKYVDTNKKEIA